MFGIAIATSAVAVGNRCPWVKAGVGAVTTQHRTDTRSGPIGIDLLTQGLSAQEVVSILAASNDFPQERQFAAVDREGRTAFYNGPEIECINAGYSGYQCVATGNFIANTDIPYHMVKAYEAKPIMSSALLITDRNAWPLVDLRIDWQENPLDELRLLWEFFKPHQERFIKQVLTPAALTLLSDSPMNV
jgi:uncharacterized Ntn-hydrolase superfamily protein